MGTNLRYSASIADNLVTVELVNRSSIDSRFDDAVASFRQHTAVDSPLVDFKNIWMLPINGRRNVYLIFIRLLLVVWGIVATIMLAKDVVSYRARKK